MSERERYQAYLTGREWGLLKQQVKARSGGVCERCKINPSDAVHHLTYARKYHERLEDLQDICEECHLYVHGKSQFDPAEMPPKEPRESQVETEHGRLLELDRLREHGPPPEAMADLDTKECPFCNEVNPTGMFYYTWFDKNDVIYLFITKMCVKCLWEKCVKGPRFNSISKRFYEAGKLAFETHGELYLDSDLLPAVRYSNGVSS